MKFVILFDYFKQSQHKTVRLDVILEDKLTMNFFW